MPSLSDIATFVLFPIYYLMQQGSQYYLPTYLGAAITAIVLYLVLNKRRRMSIRGAIQLVMPRRLLRHHSSKLDAKLFFVGVYYLLLQVLVVGGTTILTVKGTVSVLESAFGPQHVAAGPIWLVTGATMILVFLAVELGYWFSHYLMHRIPALWEFHKVHHSAEVLTPLTEWRQHPIELALFPVLMFGASALVQGPMVWYFGEGAQVVNPVSANYISMAFWYTILHLRHSELPFYATGMLGKIIQAPAHHQVHHSTNPAHYDKNLGYCLSVWDWAFGTLYVPKPGEKFNYGLGHEDDALDSVIGSILTPFGRALLIIFPWAKPRPSKDKPA